MGSGNDGFRAPRSSQIWRPRRAIDNRLPNAGSTSVSIDRDWQTKSNPLLAHSGALSAASLRLLLAEPLASRAQATRAGRAPSATITVLRCLSASMSGSH